MEKVDPSVFSRPGCSHLHSTYGQGDVPDTQERLRGAKADAPSLAQVRYGVFGLGDRTYAKPSISAQEVRRVLAQLGADASASATCTTLERVCRETALDGARMARQCRSAPSAPATRRTSCRRN